MEPQVIKMYAAREQIYPREAKGRYATWRWVCVWLTQLAFYGLPWLNWNGRQALLFDLTTRKFYIFGVVLWPQDFIYLAALLIIAPICCSWSRRLPGGSGAASPVRKRCTPKSSCGSSARSKARAARAWRSTARARRCARAAKKVAKHLAWGAIALWTGFTFVGYFTPIQDLAHEVRTLNFGPWEWFWVLFYSLATYGNAGWLREQVCKYMCPYARFQSAMFDQDTLIITYDDKRGEPRGALNKKAAKDGRKPSWATASTAPCACRCARPASTSATACSTNASAAPPASTPATA